MTGELVGREQELARIASFLANPAPGPAVLVIEGDAGTGKTSLLQVALSRAAGTAVSRLVCVRGEANTGYAGLADLLGGPLRALGADLPPAQRRALEIALRPGEADREPADQHAVGRATLALLERLAAGGLIVAIDDVHWLDQPSAQALTFALRRADPSLALRVLITRRDRSATLPLGLDGPGNVMRCERLALGPLLFGTSLPSATRRRAMAAENPFHALEFAHAEATQLGRENIAAMESARLSGLYGWQGRPMPEMLRHSRRTLDWARRRGEKQAEAVALLYHCRAAVLAAEMTPAELRSELEPLLSQPELLAPHEDPRILLAMASLSTGDYETATRHLEAVYRRAVKIDEEMSLACVPAMLAEVELAAGHWQRAAAFARQAGAARFGVELYLQGLVAAHLGEVQLARQAAETLVELGAGRDLVMLTWQGRTILGFVTLSAGNAGEAHDHLGTVLDRLEASGIREPSLLAAAWSDIDALIELGELGQAREVADTLWARGLELDRPLALAIAARGHALILSARRDSDAALQALRRALAEHERVEHPFEQARTQLALGVVLRRAKQKRAAQKALGGALTIFDRLGAPLWSAKAADELERVSGRRPGGTKLTVTERRVAQLVGEGQSNREIAGRLSISTTTVAAHLTSIYGKLGVRGRAELCALPRDK